MVERRHSLSKDAARAQQIAASAVGTEELADSAVTTAKVASGAINKDKLSYEVVSVTVAAGATSGSATITDGAIVLGWYATGNQDQFVDNISAVGTTVTITLAAAATADNTFNVVLLKP